MQLLMGMPLLGLFQLPWLIFLLWRFFRSNPSLKGDASRFEEHQGLSLLWPSFSQYFVIEMFLLGFVGVSTAIYLLVAYSNWSLAVFPVAWWFGFASFVASLVLLAFIGFNRQVLIFLSSIAVVSVLCHFFLGTATAYNYDDDLAKYIPVLHWVKETGGANMGPLGPQVPLSQLMAAGLQALYLEGFDLTDLAYWDFFLSLGVVFFTGSFFPVKGSSLVLRIGFMLVLFGVMLLINPMFVNVSPLYTGPAAGFLCLALLLSPSSSFRPLFTSAIVGCACATIYFLKAPFFIISAAIYACLLSRLVAFPNRRIAAIGLVLSILPFIFVHGAAFIRTIYSSASKLASYGAADVVEKSLPGQGQVPSSPGLSSILNADPNFYGYGSVSYLSITLFLIIVALSAACSLYMPFFRGRHEALKGQPFSDRVLLPGFLVISGSTLLVGLILLQLSGLGAQDANLRYFMPSVIFLSLTASLVVARPSEGGTCFLPTIFALIFFLGSNLPSFLLRVDQQIKFGNQLSFPAAKSEFISKYTQYAFSDDSRQFFQAVQGVVPEGARILVHVGLPWRFNLKRNDIEVAEANGRLELFSAGQCDYLARRNIQFIIWQKAGLGVRDTDQWEAWGASGSGRKAFSVKAIDFLKALDDISNIFPVYEVNDRFTIIDVTGCASA